MQPENKKRPVRPPHEAGQSYTVNDFCRAERIARSQLYDMWSHGIGPDYYLNGFSRRITEDSRQKWQRKRIAAAKKVMSA
jgi:hypothetical protein